MAQEEKSRFIDRLKHPFKSHSRSSSLNSTGGAAEKPSYKNPIVREAYEEGRTQALAALGSPLKSGARSSKSGDLSSPLKSSLSSSSRGYGYQTSNDPTNGTIVSTSQGRVVSHPRKILREPVPKDKGGDFINDKLPTDESVLQQQWAEGNKTNAEAIAKNTNPNYAEDAHIKEGTGVFFDPKDTQGGLYGYGGSPADEAALRDATRATLDKRGNLKTHPSAYYEEQRRKQQDLDIEDIKKEAYEHGKKKASDESGGRESTSDKGLRVTSLDGDSDESTEAVDPKEEHQKNKSAWNEGLYAAAQEARNKKSGTSGEHPKNTSPGSGSAAAGAPSAAGAAGTVGVDLHSKESVKSAADRSNEHDGVAGGKLTGGGATLSGVGATEDNDDYNDQVEALDKKIAATQRQIDELNAGKPMAQHARTDTSAGPDASTPEDVARQNSGSSSGIGAVAGAVGAVGAAAAGAFGLYGSKLDGKKDDKQDRNHDEKAATGIGAGVSKASSLDPKVQSIIDETYKEGAKKGSYHSGVEKGSYVAGVEQGSYDTGKENVQAQSEAKNISKEDTSKEISTGQQNSFIGGALGAVNSFSSKTLGFDSLETIDKDDTAKEASKPQKDTQKSSSKSITPAPLAGTIGSAGAIAAEKIGFGGSSTASPDIEKLLKEAYEEGKKKAIAEDLKDSKNTSGESESQGSGAGLIGGIRNAISGYTGYGSSAKDASATKDSADAAEIGDNNLSGQTKNLLTADPAKKELTSHEDDSISKSSNRNDNDTFVNDDTSQATESSSGRGFSGIVGGVAGALGGAATAVGLSKLNLKGNAPAQNADHDESLIASAEKQFDDVSKAPPHRTSGDPLKNSQDAATKDTGDGVQAVPGLAPSSSDPKETDKEKGSGSNGLDLEKIVDEHNKKLNLTNNKKSLVEVAEENDPELKNKSQSYRASSDTADKTDDKNTKLDKGSNCKYGPTEGSSKSYGMNHDTDKTADSLLNTRDRSVTNNAESSNYHAQGGLIPGGTNTNNKSHKLDARLEKELYDAGKNKAVDEMAVLKAAHEEGVKKFYEEEGNLQGALDVSAAEKNKSAPHTGSKNLNRKSSTNVGHPVGGGAHNAANQPHSKSHENEQELLVEVIGLNDKEEASKVAHLASKQLSKKGVDLTDSKIVVDTRSKEIYTTSPDESASAGYDVTKDEHRPIEPLGAAAAGGYVNMPGENTRSIYGSNAQHKGKEDQSKSSKGGPYTTGYDVTKDEKRPLETLGTAAAGGYVNMPFEGIDHKSASHRNASQHEQARERLAAAAQKKGTHAEKSGISSRETQPSKSNEPTSLANQKDVPITVKGVRDERKAELLAKEALVQVQHSSREIPNVKSLVVDGRTGVVSDEFANHIETLPGYRLDQAKKKQSNQDSTPRSGGETFIENKKDVSHGIDSHVSHDNSYAETLMASDTASQIDYTPNSTILMPGSFF